MKLSASLIVRNESTEIVACLDSIAGADEIVVVDTGSVDDTRELVSAWADRHPETRVIQDAFVWVDDFAAARNYAASLCTGDWILTISADGRMAPGSIDLLRSALKRRPLTARTVEITQRSGRSTHRRLMVHRPGVSWTGRVHENLSDSSDPHRAPEVIMDYGWSQSHAYDRDRNLRILRAEVARHPTPRTLYYLGAELWDRRELAEAEPYFVRVTETSPWHPERADAWLYLAKIRWQLQRGDEAREACLRSLLLAPDCREAVELMATMSWPAQASVWRRYAAVARNEGVLFARSSVVGPEAS